MEEEMLVFGFEDLVNGIGGALGLFLGWSILSVVSEGYDILASLMRSYGRKLVDVCQGTNMVSEGKLR